MKPDWKWNEAPSVRENRHAGGVPLRLVMIPARSIPIASTSPSEDMKMSMMIYHSTTAKTETADAQHRLAQISHESDVVPSMNASEIV